MRPEGRLLSTEFRATSQKLVEFIEAERARAALLEYRYLNYYLVPNTQRVLGVHTTSNGELIEVTPKGREYIQWRGPLPQLAP